MNNHYEINEQYLGDGVYAIFDKKRSSIVLRTSSHKSEECEHEIYLESEVLHKLGAYIMWHIHERLIKNITPQ